MTDAAELVLGVDGGGTKTVAWLAAINDTTPKQVVGRGTAGPSNVCKLTADAATENLHAAITAAFADANLDPARVASACLGLAGVGRDDQRATIRQWAVRRGIADRVQVVHDALPVLCAATPDRCGAALISGTGSLAFGRNATGATARCGGWGHLLGDEGSGYAIALGGLRAAARAADGRGPRTSLLDLFLKHLDLGKPPELISAIYADTVDLPTIAGLCTVVFQACDSGDPLAARIVRQASCELAELVVSVARALQLAERAMALALTGSVLLSRPDMRDSLLAELEHCDIHPHPVIVKDPVAGAIRIARQAALV